MAIPTFEEFMLPTLALLNTTKESSIYEINEYIAKHFNLSAEERAQLLPSGKGITYRNRASWARTDLKKAGLITQIAKGKFAITESGKKLMKKPPENITRKFLSENYVVHQTWREKSIIHNRSTENTNANIEESKETPEETIEQNFDYLKNILIEDILNKIQEASPSFFEKLVVDLLEKMNYGTGRVLGRTGDGGIDGIIYEDRLGLDAVYIQAKRWNQAVGEPEIRNFVGALEINGATKGVFFATSEYSPKAQQYCDKISSKKIVLINGRRLAELMIDYDVGVSVERTYAIKRIDNDYFEDE